MYGLQIALQHLRRQGETVILTQKASLTEVPPLERIKLLPIFQLAEKLDSYRKLNPDEILSFKHAALHGCSSDFSGFPGQDKIWGTPNVACCAIEHLIFTQHGKTVAKNYDLFIAISRWNEAYLKSLDVGPVALCYQGIDPALFHPGPDSGLFADRFVIFSGGKFEFRKGQDIVLAAYKRFREKHKDALLITCWQNLTKPHPKPFQLAGHIETVPLPAPDYGLLITPWLLEMGLPPDSFIDLPFTHNLLMPSILRECDVALFPNRCEGGTNLVAMEAMACAVPTYVSYNTGQKDLVDLLGCGPFRDQGQPRADSSMNTLMDWGESSVDEIVDNLEWVYSHREEARAKAFDTAHKMTAFSWSSRNDVLLDVIEGKNRA